MQKKVPLLGGDYEARWLGANAQRCLNYFAEKTQQDSPFPFTYYQSPGLTIQSQPPTAGYGRMLYTASNGDLYAVVGFELYYISPSLTWTAIQSLTTGGPTPASMADNGIAGLVVDGSTNGYAINLTSRASQAVNAGNSGAFYGADRVDYVDTYFLLNRPGTNQFYISLSDVAVADLTGGPLVAGTITAAGTSYTAGTYYDVPLTNGAGNSATANIVVGGGGGVTSVSYVVAGNDYRAGDVLSAVIGGAIATGSLTAGGTGYTDGTYTSVSLIDGNGSGAIASITVSGGIVTAVSITSSGINYLAGDVLSAEASVIGASGSGFTWTVATVATSGSGFAYTVATVGSSAFDQLDIAAKTGWPDPLANGPVVMHREVWLIGTKTSEVWFNSGASDFTFQALPGVFIEHGCIAPWSIAAQDINIYWLSQDKQGRAIVARGANYTATSISTHAIENEFQSYPTLTDAVGFCYQQDGHVFYQLSFPTANATWVYDASENKWHEKCWLDGNGNENRHRANVFANAYGMNLCLDWQTGTLYLLDQNNYTDFGGPIKFLRSFPHLGSSGERNFYSSFILDIETGTISGTLTTNPPPAVTMRYSDTRGSSWGQPTERGLGATGQYGFYPTWFRCGYGRDRVFEVSHSVAAEVALQGAYVRVKTGSS